MCYKLKVWKLPLGGPNTRGKALVNLLPLDQDEQVNSIMALPEDEESWKDLDIMFAARSGGVRRNSLADFTRVNRNGKIAMKPDEGDGIVDVRVVSEDHDVLLTTAMGKTIRFRVTDVRRFNSRASTGVRGIRLADGDQVISMAILRHVDVSQDERMAFIKRSTAERRALGDAVETETPDEETDMLLSDERYGFLSANEEFVLTIADDGLGKRTSSFRYACKNRGGKGMVAQILNRGKKAPPALLVRSFTVEEDNQIMLVTDGGQLIRTPVRNISISQRSAKGVWVLRTREGEKVVSVGRIEESDDDEGSVDQDSVDQDSGEQDSGEQGSDGSGAAS
jgi:DNA gyrase subunit A